ncbi:E3 ubiquitin-protein ligase PRT6-like isoform X1 [Chenopodium quinoa]|uniref:E3 ubiquitin-protein ligase n=1 Tax=Chenopodium quinoa TaxID=63459 RepID=A0A803MGU2_CHEQI|nr:E3 ubiquitin-protein ligase PRT6-like isoform X1 [Chenopodium quinoa]XP_021766422.1 E3 ubiquitin-protein ligase PRT6-like isoform X1 [Chenopodium quinoa]XP_021766423.1 E3 ubiquitin-protein ligase PRT6-like isoform X1 [Chenopodium quinoa]
MDNDSPSPSSSSPSLSPRHRIIQRLAVIGVPEDYLKDLQSGLIRFIKFNKHLLPDIVSAILPTDTDIEGVVGQKKFGSKKALGHPNLKDVYNESMIWLKWLMFEHEPSIALKNLASLNVGQRGVCGSVWGRNDLAFRCKTCEHDPTCAICVPCFQNGNHENHDYSIIYTGGGCCDCGDETAWKREGFCSKHKGAEQIQPLPDEIGNSVGPVLDLLLRCWKGKLSVVENMLRGDSVTKHDTEPRIVANAFSYVVVEMLLDFCNQSESLLSFVSKRLCDTVDLLNMLARAERFLGDDATKMLHELLLKLLAEPIFKLEFAKAFVDYYPAPVAEVLRTSSDNVLKKYPLISTFSVQILTVPTLIPYLVKERNLLAMLLECLGEILFSCCGEDGQFQFNKWVGVFDTCSRVMEDIKFVVSHSVVAKYVTHERPDIVKVWLQILSLVQGMNPQKRETSIHIEEDPENTHLPFIVCNSIASIHLLLVKSAFSAAHSEDMDKEASVEKEKLDTDDGYSQRHAKVGRLSEESSICSSAADNSTSESSSQKFDVTCNFVVIPAVLQLTCESTKAIDGWLAGSNVVSHVSSDISCCKLSAFKEALLSVKRGTYISGPSDGSSVTSACPMEIGDIEKDASTMESGTSAEKDALSLLSLSDWPDIDYDVSSQEISLHMPLHGLLSLILKEALRHYYGEFVLTDKGDFSYLNPLSSDHLDFFRKLLRGCHPYGFSSFMMEHPLQSRVFCSQVRAGMWRKNGDAAILCFNWYRSIRWSDHELELDLFLLQLCAALAPADLYVRRILERFQLSNYLALDLKRSSEYEPVLMQELLTLIIQLVKERRFCGLTASQSLQRELVCKLATGDATHSELVKSLPKDLSKLDQLQGVLDRIAHYSNPSGLNQGKYSLRMPYWKELDLYHPCWNPRDLQVAEERYSRFCGVSALSAQLPKWTNIYQPLIGIARVATCTTILQVIRAVLAYAVFTDRSTESRAPDGVLITALHLLSLALDICSLERNSGHQSTHCGECSLLVDVATEEIEVALHGGSSYQSLLSLLVLLMRMHRKENMGSSIEAGNFKISSLVEILLKKFADLDSKCVSKLQQFAPEIVNKADDTMSNSASDAEKRKMKAKEQQAAILAKMKAEQSKFLATMESSADAGFEKDDAGANEPQDSEETHVCCLCHDPNSRNPVSFLILLQKSRIVNFVDRGPPSWEQGWQSDGLESSVSTSVSIDPTAMVANASSVDSLPSSLLAQLVEGAVDEFASQGHPEELHAFIDYLKSQFPELRKIKNPGKSTEKKDKAVYSLESLEKDLFCSIHKEVSVVHDSGFIRDGEGSSSGKDAANSSYRDSSLLGKYIASLTKESRDPLQNSNSRRMEPDVQISSYGEFRPLGCDGIHVSSCGHAVHQGCLDRYLSSLKERLIRRMVFEGGHIVDPDQGEFLCPVCRRLANSTLPAVPGDSHKLWEKPTNFNISTVHPFGSLTESKKENGSLQLQYTLSILQTAASAVSRGEMLKALPMQRNRRIRPNLEPVFQLLSGMYFPDKQDTISRSGRVSPSVLMWATLKYSLISTEIAARCGKSSLGARNGLSSLYDEFNSSGGFILPLLLKIIQSTRSKNLPDLLVRFRGLQLFSESICCGLTHGKGHREGISGEGRLLYLLKHTNGGMEYPDMQFWDQASHPVLIHDPFSTLMWILFCLPYPFLSSKECFLSLVHTFYGVSIIQAILTYCSYSQCNVTDLGFHDCLVADIAKLAGKSAIAKKFFVSKYVDPSCHVKDMIDNLSLPYLRRCLLLWKLLKCSAISPSLPRVGDFDKSLDISDCQEATGNLGDRDEINELRNMFGIPPLDIALKDGGLRSMMLKWFDHFSKEFEDQCVQRVLHSTPAVPFQLMRLPVVYQDLVQRFIKVRCPNCEVVQEEPALCLLCGRLCSPAWKSCCSESGCQAHAASCGAGTGVFLLIRKTMILLQRNARQAPWPSPYLDAYGEEDVEMRRGKPLFLNEERYAALTYMVASHGLDRSSKVLHQTTIGTFFMV